MHAELEHENVAIPVKLRALQSKGNSSGRIGHRRLRARAAEA